MCSSRRQGESGDGDEEGEEAADAALGGSSLPKVKDPSMSSIDLDQKAKKVVRKDIKDLEDKKAKFKKKLE